MEMLELNATANALMKASMTKTKDDAANHVQRCFRGHLARKEVTYFKFFFNILLVLTETGM